MEIKAYNCPKCGASLNEKVSFCSYCGAKLYFDDGTKNINYNYKTEDVAKVKQVELNKEIELRKMEQQSRFVENKWVLNFIYFYIIMFTAFGGISVYGNNNLGSKITFSLFVILLVALYIIIYTNLHNKSKNQEKELQNIVNEIYNDIKTGNYDIALIKTKSLYYTEKWSNDIKKKWDDTRKSLIKMIKEKSIVESRK